jgi:tetratricopeptide (TPR) repeat protein
MNDQQRFEEALLLKAEQRHAEALPILEQLEKVQPRSAALYAVLGDTYWELRLMDKAIAAFRFATVLSPKSETASLCLFHCLWELGEYDKAIVEAYRFLRLGDSEDYRAILMEIGSIER